MSPSLNISVRYFPWILLDLLSKFEAAQGGIVRPYAAAPHNGPHDVNTTTPQLWTRHPSIGQGPRQEHAVVACGQSVYIVGGVYYNNAYQVETTNRIEAFDTETQTWHAAAPLPQAVNHPNAASVGGKVYILGALSAGGNWTAVNSSYVYAPNNDTWESIASLPTGTERGSSAAGVWNDTIYLAGGMQFLEIIPPFQQDSVDWVSSYIVRTNQWDTRLPSLPEPRQHVSGVVVGSTFYVIGG